MPDDQKPLAGTPRGWAWVFEQAWRPHPDTQERLRMHVPDTVLFNEGEPFLWVFTSKEGQLKRSRPSPDGVAARTEVPFANRNLRRP